MNRDSALAVGRALNEIGGKRMVYISGSASPPFMPRYLSTKMEAEDALREMNQLKTVALRPGFIYSPKDRVWYFFSEKLRTKQVATIESVL